MHRCFQVPEIVRLVVSSLWGEHEPDIDIPNDTSLSPSYGTYGTIARLARTCKTIQPHALDALWSCQWGIENLIRCMHPNLLVRKKTSLGPSKGKRFMLCLTKPRIKPTDWGSFDYYARRIKRLKMPMPDHPYLTPVAPDVYRALAMCYHHRRPYLPNLTHLVCDLPELSPDVLSICVTLLGPSLRTLRVHGDHGDLISVPFVLSSSLRLSPFVQQLAVTLGPSLDGTSLLISALSSLNSLHALSLTLHAAPPVELWIALSAAPSLTRLSLGLPTSPSNSVAFASNLESGTVLDFSRITHLTLRNIDVVDCVSIFGCSSFASLVGIYITSPFKELANGPDLAKAIAVSCPLTLREISLDSSIKPISGIPADSLLCFREVTHLNLSVISNLDDAILKDIARTWPNLRKLGLMYHKDQKRPGKGHWPEGVTPKGLAHLVRECPDLRDLSLQMDLRRVGISEARPWSGTTNVEIKTLDVGSSLVADAALTAAFLSDLFPSLATISQHGGTPDYSGRWAEVARLLSVFRTVRAQERQRII